MVPSFPPGLSTKSNTKQGAVIGATWHTAVVGVNTESPPGAATLTTDCPKLLYEASRSKTAGELNPNAPNPIGPVAETAIPFPDCAGIENRGPFRSTPLLPAALTTSVPRASA